MEEEEEPPAPLGVAPPAGEGSGQAVPGLASGAAAPRPITDLSGRRSLPRQRWGHSAAPPSGRYSFLRLHEEKCLFKGKSWGTRKLKGRNVGCKL